MIERILKYLLLIVLAGHVLFLGLYIRNAWKQVYLQRDIPQAARSFSIPQGATLKDVLERLEKLELAPAPLYVRLVLAWEGKRLVVKKGHYMLPERASTWDILDLFEQGKVELHKVTIPEGLDKWQAAELLGEHRWGDKDAFMALVNRGELIHEIDPDALDLEGYLYPETYFFPKDATPEEIVKSMVRQFIEETEALRLELGERGLTVREWVALGSLIERETSVPEERPVISGVFENRLQRGMLLQCDPTIIYSLKRENQYKGKIYKSQILYDSPYNTYVYKGLPPGPIASPGLSSLEAALKPQETPYYYFVARNDGTHQFSKTLREHNRAVSKFRRGR